MKITLITGAPRSGTSMIAGIIAKCGAFGGKTSPPNPNNQKGMFENMYIRNQLVKPFLKNLGVDPLGQFPLPNPRRFIPKNKYAKPMLQGRELRRQVLTTFHNEGWDRKAPLYYKGPKMCIMWPFWVFSFPEAKWLLVHRDIDQIAASCKRTPFMKAYESAHEWKWFAEKYREYMGKIKEYIPEDRWREVWSNKVIEDYTLMKPMIDWLGLEWKEDEVREFIDPALYNQGRS